MGRYPTVDEEAGDQLVIDLALGELKTPAKTRRKPERLSWRVLAKRMVSRHRQREFIWAAARATSRAEKKTCRAVLPKSPAVRSTGKTRPASPPSPPRAKNRQEPSWARMTPA